MKIVFLDAGTLFEIDNLNSLDSLGKVDFYHQTLPNEVIERIENAEIVITNKVILNSKILSKCKNLKLICVAATGINNIDKDFADKNGILIKNASGYSTNSVAQVTFTMILTLIHSPYYYDNYVKSGLYAQNLFFTHIGKPFFELKNKNLGIIGLGNIGKQVAKIADSFGMNVSYASFSGNERAEKYPKLSLEEILKTSDVISIHTPLTEKTKNLIGIAELKQMKKTAILINVARGGIVIEKDLAQALNEDIIAAAATDVFDNEPINSNNSLLNIYNKEKIITFPHIAWASKESRKLLVNIIYKNIEEYLMSKN